MVLIEELCQIKKTELRICSGVMVSALMMSLGFNLTVIADVIVLHPKKFTINEPKYNFCNHIFVLFLLLYFQFN